MTVAVKVFDCPKTLGSGAAVRDVVVAAAVTVAVSMGEVLALKLASAL